MFLRTCHPTGVPGDRAALQFAPHKEIVQETAFGQKSTNRMLGNESNPKFLMFSN